MRVRDIMTQPPQTCSADTSLAAASRRMHAAGCGMLAVVDSTQRLVGVLTDRDLAMAVGDTVRDAARIAADKAMTHLVHTVRPEDTLRFALTRMASARVRRLPVVDREAHIAGVLSVDDIVMWGIGEEGVRMDELTAALREICAPRGVALERER